MGEIEAAIKIEKLEKTYVTQDGASIRALGPVSMTVCPHEFVSIVGPSGCGKSTLLKIVAGLIPLSCGTVKIRDENVTAPRPDVGIIFQSPVLLPWKTILENVLLPIKVRKQSVADFTERAMDLICLVGLEGFHGKYPNELSGGMQQRAAIVRALANAPASALGNIMYSIVRALVGNPDILLMDEPFGALDAITRDQMNLELLAIWARTRKTVLFITHGISEAVFLSDRVIVLGARPGLIIEDLVVDLPRPRVIEHMTIPAFSDATNRIRLALERGAVFNSAIDSKTTAEPRI